MRDDRDSLKPARLPFPIATREEQHPLPQGRRLDGGYSQILSQASLAVGLSWGETSPSLAGSCPWPGPADLLCQTYVYWPSLCLQVYRFCGYHSVVPSVVATMPSGLQVCG